MMSQLGRQGKLDLLYSLGETEWCIGYEYLFNLLIHRDIPHVSDNTVGVPVGKKGAYRMLPDFQISTHLAE